MERVITQGGGATVWVAGQEVFLLTGGRQRPVGTVTFLVAKVLRHYWVSLQFTTVHYSSVLALMASTIVTT